MLLRVCLCCAVKSVVQELESAYSLNLDDATVTTSPRVGVDRLQQLFANCGPELVPLRFRKYMHPWNSVRVQRALLVDLLFQKLS